MSAVKISLMITCLADVMRPEAGKATVSLLRRLGHEIRFRSEQTCCGQPLFNSGFNDLARRQAQHTIEVFADDDVVVTPSGSCAAMIKVEYAHLFEEDEQWKARSDDLASRTFELSDFLVNQLGIVDVGASYHGKVAYHYSCHLRMLQQTTEVQRLIEQIEGAEYVSLEGQDECCGFGGSFAIRYPAISGAMVDEKSNRVVQTGADVLVSTDIGCLMNVGGRLHREKHSVAVMHIAELLEHGR